MKIFIEIAIFAKATAGAHAPRLGIFMALLLLFYTPSALRAAPDIDAADNRVAAAFERVRACLADRQYDEAVEILRGQMENAGDKLWPVTPRRYITVRDYCQMQLAGLPPDALAIYRGRIDPMAQIWYKEGIAGRDRDKLLLVVRRAFAGRFGDDALLALGEMALEKADYAAARGYWEKILPVDKAQTPAWLSYPDTDIDPAAVRARLVLASVLEGSQQRAQAELVEFVRLHGDARGRFGGGESNYAQALERLLAQSRQWPPPRINPDWPTFAGTQWRNKVAPSSVDPAGPAWRVRLGERKSAHTEPNFHPAVVGNIIFVATSHEILGLDLRTGKPAWGQPELGIFRDELADSRAVRPAQAAQAARLMQGMMSTATADPGLWSSTLTVQGGRLFASMRSPVGGGYLVCLDLEAEGRLLWRIEPENNDWAFEGAPVCDGENVYVAMRMIGIRPQAYVACFDAQTGRGRWRRYICGADPTTFAMQTQATHQLLTLKGERIYYNTNIGAVAALSTADGQLEWVSLYPQSKSPGTRPIVGITVKPQPSDPNPCLYHHGVLYVAPSDSSRVLAIDAVTGQILWQSSPQIENVTQLLGVADGQLIASGNRLYWIETGTGNAPGTGGKLKALWPRSESGPGFGRGLLAGPYVYWPTREKIFVFDRRSAQLVNSIELGPKNACGGNLVIAQGRLLIATAEELIAFGRTAGKSADEKDNATAASDRADQISVATVH